MLKRSLGDVLRSHGFRLPRDITPGPRSRMLMTRAYEEEGMPVPDFCNSDETFILLFPRSFVERVAGLSREKRYQYSFVGAVLGNEVAANRRWVLNFARRKFGKNSYLRITDAPAGCGEIGPYDRSVRDAPQSFVPRDTPIEERTRFDETYFRIMCQSEFTLCPAGDLGWSMRFFEAIMCRSVPILKHPFQRGRNRLERDIGYRFLLSRGRHHYHEDWVEANYRTFLDRQTLIR